MRAERRADKRSEIIISSIHPTIGIKDRSMPTSAGGSEITREIARITRARAAADDRRLKAQPPPKRWRAVVGPLWMKRRSKRLHESWWKRNSVDLQPCP